MFLTKTRRSQMAFNRAGRSDFVPSTFTECSAVANMDLGRKPGLWLSVHGYMDLGRAPELRPSAGHRDLERTPVAGPSAGDSWPSVERSSMGEA